MKRTTMIVEGQKYELVQDPGNDPFFGCKLCELCDKCYPSSLLCDEAGRSDCHFERVSEADQSLPPSEELEAILFGF